LACASSGMEYELEEYPQYKITIPEDLETGTIVKIEDKLNGIISHIPLGVIESIYQKVHY
jgi:hypothetical protein